MKQLTRKNLAKIYLRLADEHGPKRASKLFAELVQSLGQRREIDLILKDIEQELFKQNRRLEVDVYSAHQLDQENLELVKRVFQSITGAESVAINSRPDPQIRGGLRARALDFELDQTLKKQLERLEIQ
jgi:F0F1-type ATP synthase delta subunit